MKAASLPNKGIIDGMAAFVKTGVANVRHP